MKVNYHKVGHVEMLSQNEQDLEKFIQMKVVNGESSHTTEYYERYVREFDSFLNKPFRDATEEDVMAYITYRTKVSDESTVLLVKLVIKKFYQYLYGMDDGEFPQQVKRMKLTNKHNGQKLPVESSDVLDKNDIAKIVRSCQNDRDEAMVTTLYDSGTRLGEFAGMSIRDLKDVKHGKELVVDGKTGKRRILLVECLPYLNKWISKHPLKNEPNAPLWVSLTEPHNRLSNHEIQKIITIVGKRSKVGKRINVHNYRHSRATYLSNYLTDQQMKVFFGWTKNSNMVAVYSHLAGKDTDAGILKSNGIVDTEEIVKSPLESKKCPRCEETSPGTADFCVRCGKPFKENPVEVMESFDMKSMEERFAKMIQDANTRTLEAMERRLSDLQIQIGEKQLEKLNKVTNGHVCPKCGQEPQGQAVKTWMLGESTLVSRFECQCGSQFNVYTKLMEVAQ